MPEDWQGAVAAHRARYRDRILDAAVELVRSQGATGLSMAGLAQHAGIGRATLYKYFPDLEHVLAAQAEREVDRWADQLAGALARHDDPVARLRAYIETLYAHFAAAGGTAGPVDSPALSRAAARVLRDHMGKILDPLVAILADGVASGAFRPDLDPQRGALLISAALGTFREDLNAGRMAADEAAGAVWDLLTRGLLA